MSSFEVLRRVQGLGTGEFKMNKKHEGTPKEPKNTCPQKCEQGWISPTKLQSRPIGLQLHELPIRFDPGTSPKHGSLLKLVACALLIPTLKKHPEGGTRTPLMRNISILYSKCAIVKLQRRSIAQIRRCTCAMTKKHTDLLTDAGLRCQLRLQMLTRNNLTHRFVYSMFGEGCACLGAHPALVTVLGSRSQPCRFYRSCACAGSEEGLALRYMSHNSTTQYHEKMHSKRHMTCRTERVLKVVPVCCMHSVSEVLQPATLRRLQMVQVDGTIIDTW